MATIKEIEQRASLEDRFLVDEDAILVWWSALDLAGNGRDITVPEKLGSIDAVEKFCDSLNLPFYVVDRVSRCASVANNYTSLKRREEWR